MRLEIYAPRDSVVHRLHPATKLALLAAGMVAPFLTQELAPQAVSMIAALAVAAAGRVLREVLAPWKLLAFIFVSSVILWTIAWKYTWAASSAYSLRVTGIFVLGLAFLATTRVEEAVHALESVGVPYRLSFALGLAFRLVPLFLGAAASITEAQRARGLDLERGRVHERLAKYVPILVPVFMTSLRDADQMAMALDARGFSAGVPRTRWRVYAFGARDLVALAIGAAYLGWFAVSRYGAQSLVPH